MKLRLSIVVSPGNAVTFEHAGPVIRIGRDPDCELCLQGEASTGVSRQHARIELTSEDATVVDTGSSNGTLLNGQLLEAAAPLHLGDRIQMGYTGPTLTVVELDLISSPQRRYSSFALRAARRPRGRHPGSHCRRSSDPIYPNERRRPQTCKALRQNTTWVRGKPRAKTSSPSDPREREANAPTGQAGTSSGERRKPARAKK